MKTNLCISVACSLASLLGLLGLSAISLVPEMETRRWPMMLIVGILLVGGCAWRFGPECDCERPAVPLSHLPVSRLRSSSGVRFRFF